MSTEQSTGNGGRFVKGTSGNAKGRPPAKAKTLKAALLEKLRTPGRSDRLAESLLKRVESGEPGIASILSRILDVVETEEQKKPSKRNLHLLTVPELALLHALVSKMEQRPLSLDDEASLARAVAATSATRPVSAVEPKPEPAASKALGDPAAETERTSDVAATEDAGSVSEHVGDVAPVEPEREPEAEQPRGRVVEFAARRDPWAHPE